MLFNSMAYAVFLPLVFVAYWLLPHKFRWALLLIASYYFYMSWNLKYVFLIFFTTIVSYIAARLISGEENTARKKWILAGATVLCLGVLFIFKYFNFLSSSVADFLSLFTIQLNPITLNLLLPVGISFYTFQTLSYVIDVYKGDVQAEKHFGYYAVFISFFPQLVAGPIERTSNLLPQIKGEHSFDYDKATYGLKLMAWGYFKKLAVADVVSVYVDSTYASLGTSTGAELLLAIFLFTIQIYCDFSGYSDIAIGTAKLLGIDLMTNFKSPYFSTSIRKFWSRWHISLSTWFRDYVYIPLGGNRCSKLRRDRNLLITFLVSGLWHGANWTYVAWGALHGIAQIIENHIHIAKDSKILKFISWLAVFIFCNIAWVFFRAESISDACFVLSALAKDIAHSSGFFYTVVELVKTQLRAVLLSIAVLFCFDYAATKTDVILWLSKKNAVLRWAIYIGLIWLIFVSMNPSGTSEFVYFQF